MASKKKEELLQPEVQTQAQPAAQSTYSAEGLNSRADVEKAMANVSYRPGQQVTDAADALKQWQQNRPADYQSSYQDKINSLLGQLLERENFQYSYTRDPLYRQYEQLYTQNAHNASADAAAQAAAAAMPTDFLLSFIGWGFVSVCALSAELVIKALLSIFCRIASRFSDLLSLWDFFIISVIFIALFLLFTVCFFQLVKGAV